MVGFGFSIYWILSTFAQALANCFYVYESKNFPALLLLSDYAIRMGSVS